MDLKIFLHTTFVFYTQRSLVPLIVLLVELNTVKFLLFLLNEFKIKWSCEKFFEGWILKNLKFPKGNRLQSKMNHCHSILLQSEVAI